jgi:hypothetical protein
VTARPRPGDVVAGHRLERVLGEGGMGAVYLGASERGERRAIKLAPPDAGPEERERFEREAQALAKLPPHPHVVRVHGAGRDGGASYCLLEWIEGRSLDDELRAGPLAVDRALDVAEQIAHGLEHVHRAGLVHRDVKPSNILLRADGTAVLADFGLALDLTRTRMTETGMALGTPEYMAPEQAEGRKDIGPAADVWGLGATLYRAVAGAPPFHGATRFELLKAILERDPVPPSSLREGIPPEVDEVVMRALAKDRAVRFRSAAEMLQAIRDARARRAAAAPRQWARAAAGFALTAVAIAGAVALARRNGATEPPAPPVLPSAAPKQRDPLDAIEALIAGGEPEKALAELARQPRVPRAGALRGRAYAKLPREEQEKRTSEVCKIILSDRFARPDIARATWDELAASADPKVAATIIAGIVDRDERALEVLVPPRRLGAALEGLIHNGDDASTLARRYGLATAADPSIPVPVSLPTAYQLESAPLRAPKLAALSITIARAGMPFPGNMRISDDLLEEISSRAKGSNDWAADLALADARVQSVAGMSDDDNPRARALREECARKLGTIADRRDLPIAARVTARYLEGRAYEGTANPEKAITALRRAFEDGSPFPDECCERIAAVQFDQIEHDRPGPLAVEDGIAWARRSVDLTLERCRRTDTDSLRRDRRDLPAFYPLGVTARDGALLKRRQQLAALELFAGKLDDAYADAAVSKSLDLAGRDFYSWPHVQCCIHLIRGEEEKARAILEEVLRTSTERAEHVRATRRITEHCSERLHVTSLPDLARFFAPFERAR